MHLMITDTGGIDDDTPKVPSPVDDALMSPQARRYFATLHLQSETGISGSGSSSTGVMASTKHQ